jgi:hypothetical protein
VNRGAVLQDMKLCFCESRAVENPICVIPSVESKNHYQSILIEFRVLSFHFAFSWEHGCSTVIASYIG